MFLRRFEQTHLRRYLTTTVVKKVRKREKPPPISVTSRAAERIQELMQGNDESIGVIIGVKRRGCNGLSYIMNHATNDDLKDLKKYEVVDVPTHNLKVLVDTNALFSIVGTRMDFEETALSSEFTFNNPNAKGKCGCGESFSI